MRNNVLERKTKTFTATTMLILVFMLVLTACTQGNNNANESPAGNTNNNTSSANEEQPAKGGTFVYGRPASVNSLDLHKQITSNNAFAIDKIFESLVTFNSEGEIVDGLAESHTISEDGLTYTFVLRQGLKFSNGQEVTVEDAVFSIQRGWDFIASNRNAPRNSILSLLDLKNAHDDVAKGRIPANIPTLEARALIEGLHRIEEEGLESVYRRHSLSSASTIAGLKALGLEPRQKHQSSYSPLVTTIRVPQQRKQLHLERPLGIVAPGDGQLKGSLLRINHYGVNANPDSVEEAVLTLAELLEQDLSDAIAAVKAVWNNG